MVLILVVVGQSGMRLTFVMVGTLKQGYMSTHDCSAGRQYELQVVLKGKWLKVVSMRNR